MGIALAKWMEPGAPGEQRCVERMMLELVDNRADWIAVALAHYGLLVNTRKVTLVEQPVIAGLHRPHRHRFGMKFKTALRNIGVEKPVAAVTVWNTHSPSPNLKIGARRGVWETFTDRASRAIVGGDLTMTRQQEDTFNQTLQPAQRWLMFELSKVKHGDLYLTRNVNRELMHPATRIEHRSKPSHSSDTQNVCAI